MRIFWSTLIGFLAGAFLAPTFLIPVSHWQQLSYQALEPSEDKPIEILAYNLFAEEVYIRGTSQAIYACRSSIFDSHESTVCMKLTPDSWSEFVNGSPCESWQVFPTPGPPGTIVARRESCFGIGDGSVHVAHIVLEDGSVWRWSDSKSDLGDAVYRGLHCVGGLGGALLGLVIGAFLSRGKKPVDER